MVVGVCRTALRDPDDVQDAFQATFMVLVRKARSLWVGDSLGPWLHRVACRVSHRARESRAARCKHERRAAELHLASSSEPSYPDDLATVLHQEIDGLPERFRTPLVLCDLELRTHVQAARDLGWPVGTIKSRLGRAREILRDRLSRRGLGLPAAPPIVGAGLRSAEMRFFGPLAESTTRTAVTLLKGRTAAAAVNASDVTMLTEEVIKAMGLAKIKTIPAGLLMASVIVAAAACALGQQGTAPRRVGERDQHRSVVTSGTRRVSEDLATSKTPGVGQSHTAGGQDLHGDPLPQGAVARLGSARFRSPDGAVEGLHFSDDGNTLLTVGGYATLRFWETSTGRLLREVQPESVYAGAVVFLPEAKQIALEGSRKIEGDVPGYESFRLLLDTASGKQVRRFKMADGDGDQVLAITPDGKYLLSLGNLGVLRIEEIATGTEVLEQRFPRNNSTRLAVSPDGKTAAVWKGPNTRNLYLWEWQEGGEPRELRVPRHGLQELTFSPDGKSLVACSSHESYVWEWDIATGRLRDEVVLRDDITPFGLALHPDGKTMAVSDYGNRKDKQLSGGVLLLERGTGRIVRELPTPGASASRVSFSLDGRWLAAVAGGRVHVWDLRSGAEVAAAEAGHQVAIAQITTAPNGLIATAGDDHTVRLWDAATGKERTTIATRRLGAHRRPVARRQPARLIQSRRHRPHLGYVSGQGDIQAAWIRPKRRSPSCRLPCGRWAIAFLG